MQPGQGVTTKKRSKIALPQVTSSYTYAADLGPDAPRQVYAVNYDEFIKQYLEDLDICDVTIKLSRTCPPTPFHCKRKIMDARGSKMRRLQELKSRISSASDAEILVIMGQVRQLSLPKS